MRRDRRGRRPRSRWSGGRPPASCPRPRASRRRWPSPRSGRPGSAQPAPPAPPPVRRITPSTALAGDGPAPPPRAALVLAGRRGAARRRARPPRPPPPPVAARHRARPRGARSARRFLEALATGEAWPAADRDALLDRTLAVLDHPDFAAGLRAGQPRRGRDRRRGSAARPLSGRIDRLAVADDRVLIVDYKTNRPAPASVADAPHEYVMQLALYRRGAPAALSRKAGRGRNPVDGPAGAHGNSFRRCSILPKCRPPPARRQCRPRPAPRDGLAALTLPARPYLRSRCNNPAESSRKRGFTWLPSR